MHKRICLVRQRTYPIEQRFPEIIEVMQQQGWEVDILCMRREGDSAAMKDYNGVRVYTLPSLGRKRGSKLRYLLEYVSFLVMAFFWLGYLQARRRYAVVHLQSLPDFIVFAALLPKLMGAKLILDMAEPTPELYLDKYKDKAIPWLPKVLGWIEQASIGFADGVTTYTEQLRQTYIRRGTPARKIKVMLITPNVGIFNTQSAPKPDDDAFRVVTHGLMKPRYSIETIIHAVVKARAQVPGIRFTIIGDGEKAYVERLKQLVKALDATAYIHFTGFIDVEEMAQHLHHADCGVVALTPSTDSNLVLTYKMFEYVALDLPVLSSRTTAVEYYFKDAVILFDGGSVEQLASGLVALSQQPELRQRLQTNMRTAYASMSKVAQQRVYYNQICDILGIPRPAVEGRRPTTQLPLIQRSATPKPTVAASGNHPVVIPRQTVQRATAPLPSVRRASATGQLPTLTRPKSGTTGTLQLPGNSPLKPEGLPK